MQSFKNYTKNGFADFKKITFEIKFDGFYDQVKQTPIYSAVSWLCFTGLQSVVMLMYLALIAFLGLRLLQINGAIYHIHIVFFKEQEKTIKCV